MGSEMCIRDRNDGDCTDNLKFLNVEKSMFVLPTTVSEIIAVTKSFQSKTSEDIYYLNMKILKCIISYIAEPLLYIFNLSLMKGVFPDCLKIAKVLPLYKANEIHNVSNYRPVSLLPQISKLLEKLFNNRLRNFIEKHELLFKGQYGFRANHCTAYALNEMTDTILNAIDDNLYSIGVFIDLKKAFETVDHSLLIKN